MSKETYTSTFWRRLPTQRWARLRGVINAFASFISRTFLIALVILVSATPVARAQYIYNIRSNGDLEWRKHLGSISGTFSWSAAQTVGTGWAGFQAVFPGDDGVIYAIQNDGTLVWYKHGGNRDGSGNWSGPKVVGSGWQNFINVFSGGDGIIYAIQTNGALLWYHHLGQGTGTSVWDGPYVVGNGWDSFTKVIAGQGGAIYGILPSGDLLWYWHLGRNNGTFSWNGPVTVGTGWQVFQDVFASADGVIYGIESDGTLHWYKHLGYMTGAVSWLGGFQVGTGWFFNDVFAAVTPIEGYCWPLSAVPGETISFKVASPGDYTVRFVRFQRSGDQNQSIPLTNPVAYSAALPPTPDAAWENGCGWPESFTLQIPPNWTSGIYAAECQDPTGHPSWIVFVVKADPNSPGDFAVLVNSNTWNSYNTWGGRSKYTTPAAQAVSYLRPNPGSAPSDGGGINHLTRAELWVDDWLPTTGYRSDLYTDVDLHIGVPQLNLQQYRALILHTHPEYWTPDMMDHIESYLAGGGSVLYMAGNGLFEEVLLSPDGTLQTLFPEGQYPWRDPSAFRNLPTPRPEREILGVAYVYDCWQSYGPFQVLQAGHPLFAGTGVANGDLIGMSGINGGGANGWEMDTSISGTAANGVIVPSVLGNDRGFAPAGLVLLARGTNGCGIGDMTYYETGAGGFVFSAGSLSFGGSLVVDDILQLIVRNALFMAYHDVSAVADESSEPPRFALGRNDPNPFRSETAIDYSLAAPGRVRLDVFDVQGREVARLVDRVESAGNHTVRWNGLVSSGGPAAGGVYFYRLERTDADSTRAGAGTARLTGRMVLLR